MKKLAVSLILVLSGVQAFSQSVIRGRVVDADTREPEAGAVVQVYAGSADEGGSEGYAVTDSLGVFSITAAKGSPIDLGQGTHVVRIMNMGRRTVDIALDPSNRDLGDIPVEDDVQNLAGSTVTALKTLVRIDADKLTYDIENDADSRTMTVLDMLRKIPMVTVDAQDNISVNGSSSFKVYVDGRPNQMLSANPSQMFKLMPASAISSIEVITNPGAKYDAEGTGGVLDLKTKGGSGGKPVSDGVYGTVTAGVNSRGGVNGGVNLNAQKGKWTFGANLQGGTDPFRGVLQESSNANKATGAGTRTSYTGDADQRYFWGSLDASYEIDTLNLLTASIGGNVFRNKSFIRDGSFWLNPDGEGPAACSVGGEGNNTWNSVEGSLDYQKRFAENRNRILTFSYRFSGTPSSGEHLLEYSGALDRSIHAVTRDGSYEHTFQADYTTPLWSDSHVLSTGLKFIYRFNTADDVTSPGTAEELKSVYDYYNRIGAAYAEYTGTFGKFVSKAGLRYEHTWQKVDYASGNGQNFDVQYPALVPNFSLQYNLGMAQNVSFSYNMRIRRPGIDYLNPYVERADISSLSYGNPSVEAEQSHSFQLAWNFFTPKWVLSMRLIDAFGDKGIGRYSFYDEDGLLNSTYGNIQKSNRISLNAYVNWNASNKTRVYLFGDGGYDSFLNSMDGRSNGGWSMNGGIGAQHTLPNDFRLSGNLFANTRRYSLQGYVDGFAFCSLGVSKSFLDDRLSLSLQGMSNLGIGPLKVSMYSEGDGFVSGGWQYLPIKTASFSVSYIFGKAQGVQVKKTSRSITNDDVIGNDKGGSIAGQVTGGGM